MVKQKYTLRKKGKRQKPHLAGSKAQRREFLLALQRRLIGRKMWTTQTCLFHTPEHHNAKKHVRKATGNYRSSHSSGHHHRRRRRRIYSSGGVEGKIDDKDDYHEREEKKEMNKTCSSLKQVASSVPSRSISQTPSQISSETKFMHQCVDCKKWISPGFFFDLKSNIFLMKSKVDYRFSTKASQHFKIFSDVNALKK